LPALFSAFAAARQSVFVDIGEYRYSPPEVRVKRGDTVKRVNSERRTSHSVLLSTETGLESMRMFPGESSERGFPAPGRCEYACGPHPDMNGVVHVE